MVKKIFLVLLPVLFAGCSGTSLMSKWDENNIHIDGKREDWQGALHSEKDMKILYGAKNDKDYLYLCFVSGDQNKIRTMLAQGMIVTVGPANTGETFGIEFADEMEMPVERPGELKKGKFNPDQKRGEPGQFNDMMVNKNTIAILNEDGKRITTIPAKNDFLSAKMGFQWEQLVYELKIPLHKVELTDYYIQPGEDGKVTVQLTTKEMEGFGHGERGDREGGPGGDRGGPAGGGEGMGKGGGPGGGRSPMGGPGKDMNSSGALDFEMNITLANE